MGFSQEISAQRERLFVWAPVAFALGISLYFALTFEPVWWAGAVCFAVFLPAVFWLYHRHHDTLYWFFAYVGAVAGLLAAGGFIAAQSATSFYGTPILERGMDFANLEGTIQSIESLGEGEGSRVVLRDLQIEDVAADKTPKRIRLKFRKDEGLVAGARIGTLASIDPPSSAVAPGSYDFRRHLFFEGIGAVGFSYRVAEQDPGFRRDDNFFMFENLRSRINKSITDHSGLVSSGLMTALITGERGAIDDADNNAMRASGLYHLLSISGAHVTMVAGILFFFSRFLMACVPWFALRYPIKKYAAMIALLGAAFYVFLAGAEVPAQRALLMTGLIMVAIMLDRSPFSLRLIAFAALVVLIFAPQALVGVSFQMSFAAVAALICFFDYIRAWWMLWYARAGMVRKSLMYLIGVLMTSVIAGSVTGLFSLYHFQSFAVYGVLANMMAVPITGIVIMPAAVLSVMMMPLGLEAWPVQIMEWGTVWVLAIAHWAAGLEGAVIHVRQWPQSVFVLFVCGTVLFLLWQGWRGKAFASMLIVTGFVWGALSPIPDMFVSETGKVVAVRDGRDLYVESLRGERFAIENWMRLIGREGVRARRYDDAKSPMLCDSDGCRTEIRGMMVAMPKNPRAFAQDCVWADVIVASMPLKKWQCESSATMIDLYDAKDHGAHSVYLERTVHVRSVGEEVGVRPWTP